jgi:ornithine cyclodeaminase/alanine dehydrogenase-like protein (mu-crystallin family)
MELRYLSRAAIESLRLSMREVLAAVERGFALKGRGKTEMPPKPGIHTRPDCFIHAMPAYIQGMETAGLKWVSGYPPNIAKGLPYITGLLILNDPETGVPLAVMDCAWITAMRTGASAGISAKYLARKDCRVAGFVG